MKRNWLMVAPLMLAMSMWVYAQAGGAAGSGGSGGATAGQHSGTMGAGSNPNAPGAANTDQMGNPGQNPSAAPGDMSSGQAGNSTANNNNAGGKTLKGCIRSENGQYLLEEKGGKVAELSGGPDLSAHVGHQVKVHGNWEKGGTAASASSNGSSASAQTGTVASGSEPSAAANTGAGAQASGSASDKGSASAEAGVSGSDHAGRKTDHAGKVFQIASVDMVSENCSISSKDNNKPNYGSQAGSPQSGTSNQTSPSGQPPRK